MPLPELDVARVQRWCAAWVPEHARHQVGVECELAPRHLTIIEPRAPWREDLGPEWTSFPIARLRYTAADKSWTLYWRDRNLRDRKSTRLNSSHVEISYAVFCLKNKNKTLNQNKNSIDLFLTKTTQAKDGES